MANDRFAAISSNCNSDTNAPSIQNPSANVRCTGIQRIKYDFMDEKKGF